MPITKRQAADIQNTAMAQAQGRTTGGITPEGVIEITANGLFDVAQYAQALVNVSGGEVDDTFLAKSIEKMLNGKGFSKIEFSNVSIGANIILNHSLGYAPQTFIMVPKSTADLATNRYYAGICTNPSDGDSYTNNTAVVSVTKLAIVTLKDVTAVSNFENVVNKEFASLPQINFGGLYTFIVTSTANSFTIRNGNVLPTAQASGNALGTGDFVVFFK